MSEETIKCIHCTSKFEAKQKDIVEVSYLGFVLKTYPNVFQCQDCARQDLHSLAEDWFQDLILDGSSQTRLIIDWSVYFFAEEDCERQQILDFLCAVGVVVYESKKKGAWSLMLDGLIMNPDGNNILLNVYFAKKEYAEQYRDCPHWLHPSGKVEVIQHH
ncbi:MAG: hypothetical protein WCO30_00035 [bacterium]